MSQATLRQERYDRHSLIANYDQGSLEAVSLAMVSPETEIGNFALGALAALGAGSKDGSGISLYTNAGYDPARHQGFLFKNGLPGEPCVDALADMCFQINPYPHIIPRCERIAYGSDDRFLDKGADILIVTSNDPYAKRTVLEYAMRNDKTCILAASTHDNAEIHIVHPPQEQTLTEERKAELEISYRLALSPHYEGLEQGIDTSLFAATIITAEVVRQAMPGLYTGVSYDRSAPRSVYFNRQIAHVAQIAGHPVEYVQRVANHFRPIMVDGKPFVSQGSKPDFSGRTIAVAGCGAIGNSLVPVIARYNPKKLYLIDPDEVAVSNLARQINFPMRSRRRESLEKSASELEEALQREVIGHSKAQIMAQRTVEMVPSLEGRVVPVVLKVQDTEQLFEQVLAGQHGIDIREIDTWFGCVDNMQARAFFTELTARNGIDYHDGASTALISQVYDSIGGETACLDCTKDVIRRAIAEREHQEEAERRAGCIDVHQGSVIYTNMFAAFGLAVKAVARARRDNSQGAIGYGFQFSTNNPTYAASFDADYLAPCRCHENKE
ncbi:MAG: ThiF family adenylyltransferase [archaeon]